jgi:alanine racemase
MITDHKAKSFGAFSLDKNELRHRVDFNALILNYKKLLSLARSPDIGVTVKSRGYGLSIDNFERLISVLVVNGCRHFFTAELADAIRIRNISADSKIFLFYQPDEICWTAVRNYHFTPVLETMQQLSAAPAEFVGTPVCVHFDTGFGSIGLPGSRIGDVLALQQQGKLNVEAVMSHPAVRVSGNKQRLTEQKGLFQKAAANFPDATQSFANTAALLEQQNEPGWIARPGIGLFGSGAELLNQTIFCSGTVRNIRLREAGERIGYDSNFKIPSATRTATIDLGYAHGVPVNLSPLAAVYSDAMIRYPILGDIAMNQMTIEIPEGAPTLRSGEKVELICAEQSIDNLASYGGIPPASLVYNLNQANAQS